MKQKMKLTSEQEVQTEIYKTDVSCQTEQKVEVQSHDTHNSIYQKSARLPFFPPKTKLSDKTSSRSSTPNSLKDYTEKVDAEDLWPSLPKPSGNSLKTAKLNSPIRSSPIFPVVTRSLSPADPLLLLAPSSFSDNSNDNSSSPNSSIYYSVNDNSAILKDYDDSLQQRSRSNLNSPCEMIQHKQKEDSPLSKLIEMDAKADWSDKNKTLKPESHTPKSVKEQVVVEYSSKRKSPLHVQQRKKVPDWWDPDQEEVTQEKVKDHWDMSDSEDTSENISIKSGQTTTSLDSVAGWMMNSGNKQNELVPPSSTKSKSSHSHNITVEATKGLNSHEGLNRFTSKQFTGNKDTVQGQSSINHNDKLFFAKHSDAEMKKNIELSTIGVDKTNDDDSDSDEVDDDDDEDWETCTTDEISEAKSCDSLSCELPVDDAALNNNKQPVTIIREYTESAEKPKPSWKPSGTRKCTACGDTTHLIYDCPNRHNRRFFY